MQIHWQSRRGATRETNNDAAAVGYAGTHIVAIVVDAAAKGDGQALAQYWARSIVTAVMRAEEPLSLSALQHAICREQEQLRHRRFLLEKASYCCALLDLRDYLVDVLYVGDCQLGTEAEAGRPTWHTRPHTLDEQLQLQGLPRTAEARHLRTRCLNVRRHVEPDHVPLTLVPTDQLLLCTDGYRYEGCAAAGEETKAGDDASMLTLRTGCRSLSTQSDCDNFFIFE